MTTGDIRGGVTLSEALILTIREWLAREGWSQREFAERLGVTQSTVSFLLGRKRRMQALDFYERVAATMGLPLSQLFADLEARVTVIDKQKRRRRPGRSEEDPLIRLTGEPHADPTRDDRPRLFISYSGPEDERFNEAVHALSQGFVQFLTSEYDRRRTEYVHTATVENAPPAPAQSSDLARGGTAAQARLPPAASAQPARRAGRGRRQP
jgi:transcriptional regulator with XRE-family HTH domain